MKARGFFKDAPEPCWSAQKATLMGSMNPSRDAENPKPSRPEMLTCEDLLRHASACSIYTRWNILPEADIYPDFWASLPTISRDDLRKCAECSNVRCSKTGEIVFFTSGTTDHPKIVRMAPDDLSRIGSLCARFSHMEGITSDSRIMVLLPMGLWTVGKITVLGHVQLGAQVFPVDLHGGVTMWGRMAKEIEPTVISSTPSVLASFAPYYSGPPLELIETTGEPLLETERQLIEEAFGGPVYDAYGLSECVVGVECCEHKGYHFWPDAVKVEILDPESQEQVPEGQSGEIVVTSLMQEHMPIVRYRSGDRGHLEHLETSFCQCGVNLPRVFYEGRLSPSLEMPRGVQIPHDEMAKALRGCGASDTFLWKGSVGSAAQPYTSSSFIPTLQIEAPQTDRPMLLRKLLSALPDLAELVFEKEVEIVFTEPRIGR